MKKLAFMLSAMLPLSLVAEDIELYVGNTTLTTQDRPKVLIIFDNSGSMGNSVKVKPAFDESDYDGGSDSLNDEYIYYVKGEVTTKPNSESSTELRRFKHSSNACNTAKQRLDEVGYYIGYLREYRYTGESGAWKELPELDASSVSIVDCWDDIRLSDSENNGVNFSGGNVADGYPIDGAGDTSNPELYTSDINESDTNLGAGEIVTLYTADYLRWANDDTLTKVNRAKMDIAKEAVTALVDAAPTVDFAIEVFNHNYNGNNNGGRIAFAFKEDFNVTEANNLKTLINGLAASTWTPLCESLYEAYRYFSGSSVLFGKQSGSASPGQDFDAQDGSQNYVSPFDTCSNKINVIMITDGEPTYDSSADSYVKALPGAGGKSSYHSSYLSSLAEWMNGNDIDGNSGNGIQTTDFYTVGFSLGKASAVNLLKEAANKGGGRYLDAEDPSDLLSELQSAIVTILQKDTTFTAPSVASNNFDRTETLDSVYYAMFTPDKGPRWQGNLKKLKIRNGILVGKDNVSAIDSITGNIKDTSTTFWTSANAKDGGKVGEGGVVEMFAGMDPADRTIYSDTAGGTNPLEELTVSTASDYYGGDDKLATALGVDEDDIDDYVKWAMGYDVDNEDKDNSTSDMRPDVFGDPLHSKPLVLNYGTSETDQDVRIIIGTNSGALHMFSDDVDQSTANLDSVTESWAFMPTEFFKNIRTLRENFSSSDKVYGIDGTPVSFVIDVNDNGKIDDANDKVYVFFGLRRGGSSYYGMDLTDPDDPKLMWHIDSDDSDFAEIKQSWSTPRIGYSRINSKDSIPQPVLVFAGGYDTAKDNQTASSGADTKGKGFFMVDATTGKLLWSLTPSTSPAFQGTDSIPSAVATLDSDSDGYIDRLYAGDTGGNVWRVDMPGTNTDDWKASLLANLGSDSDDTRTGHAKDRRFFAEPTIARAIITETIEHTTTIDGQSEVVYHKSEVPYDAILIGSGDRTNPLDTSTDDMLFMIKDDNIITQDLSKKSPAPTTIAFSELYDYTADPFGSLNEESSTYEEDFNKLAADVSELRGWKVDLAQLGGEKNVAKAEVLSGVAYFNSYAPPDSSASTCEITDSGTGYLYAMDLALGTNVYVHRVFETGSALTDGITLVSVAGGYASQADEEEESNRVKGSPLAILAGEPFEPCAANGDCTGIKLKTMRSNMVVAEENQ